MSVARVVILMVLALAAASGLASPGDAKKTKRFQRAAATNEPRWLISPDYPGSDLPTAGRSLFDQMFAVRRAGEPPRFAIPYPFDKLVDEIGARGYRLGGALIPKGRSLQRLAARPKFYTFPRSVLGDQEGEIFVAFVEPAGQLEVISFNETLGRYEFQIVENYGAVPDRVNVAYAPRSKCVVCHQNHAAIFPIFPWDETNNIFAGSKVSERISDARGDLGDPNGWYLGVDLYQSFDEVQLLDDATDRAAERQRLHYAWQFGCGPKGQGSECRRALAEWALAGELTRGRAPDGGALGLESEAKQLWYEAMRREFPNGMAYSSSDLANRNPEWNEDISGEFDPRGRRDQVLTTDRQGTDYLAKGLAFEFQRRFRKADVSVVKDAWSREPKAVNAAFARMTSETDLFSGIPFDPKRILATAAAFLRGEPAPGPAPEPAFPPLKLASVPEVDDEGAPAYIGHFREACGQCHSDPRGSMPLLAGAAAQVKAHLTICADLILEALAWDSDGDTLKMPPARSKQGLALRQPEAAGRVKAMRDALEALRREPVGPLPSLTPPEVLVLRERCLGEAD